MSAEEVLEVACLRLVRRTAGIHPLDDGRHVPEHDGVHEG